MHEVEQYGDGSGSMVSTRGISPWHRLGTVVKDEALTAADALRLSRSDFEVRKEPLYVTGQELHTTGVETVHIEVPNRVATVRDHPETGLPVVLGVVGLGYTIIQNHEVFGLLDDIVDSSDAHYETAGVLQDGAVVFVCMRIPRGILIGGEDAHDLFLVAATSHNGQMSMTMMVTPIRVVCRNTLELAIRQARSRWSVYHTASADRRLNQAREDLKLTFAYAEEFEKLGNELIGEHFSDGQFDRLVRHLYEPPQDAKERALRNFDDKRARLHHLFTQAETQEPGRGTAWAALNAVSEFEDWFRQSSDEQLAVASTFGVAVPKRKAEALVAIRSMTGI